MSAPAFTYQSDRPVWWSEFEDGWRVEVRALELDDGRVFRGFVTPPGREKPVMMTLPFSEIDDADLQVMMTLERARAGRPAPRPWWRRVGARLRSLFTPRGAP